MDRFDGANPNDAGRRAPPGSWHICAYLRELTFGGRETVARVLGDLPRHLFPKEPLSASLLSLR